MSALVRGLRTDWRGLTALFAILLVLVGLLAAESPLQRRLTLAWFDFCQTVKPRMVASQPAVIVAIDEKSLAELGQWPWPRTVMARLVDQINAQKPAAIGIDVLMPEPDRLSPGTVAQTLDGAPADLIARLSALPSNDSILAASIKRAPVVLGIAGLPTPGGTLRAAPFRTRASAAALEKLPVFAGVATSLPELDAAAPGHGLLSAEPEGAIVRRILLAARVGEAIDAPLAPAFSMELIRLATQAPGFELHGSGSSIAALQTGGFTTPTDRDGAVWVYFSPREAGRYVSAVDVIKGRVPPDRLTQKFVLIGATGLGLLDHQTVPSGERMPGIEIHAQLLENFFDGTLLERPHWAGLSELLVALFIGLFLIVAVPQLARARTSLALGVGVLAVGLPLGLGMGLFVQLRWLLDAASVSVVTGLVFAAAMGLALLRIAQSNRTLELEAQVRRETAAKLQGELDAARAIQTGMLPAPGSLRDARVALGATMVPAREVGGDLYDFFKVDTDQLFFMIGDVSGKGLPASMFMAVTKALYKSAVLRARAGERDVGALMAAANEEVARENPEMLFVTAFAGILNLQTGALSYCNAGHDNPIILRAAGGTDRFAGGDGPPLCVMDDFPYNAAQGQLQPGDLLVLATDGVMEAQNLANELFTSARYEGLLQGLATQSPDQLVEKIKAEVNAFAVGRDPADDLTLLALRWNPAIADKSPT